MHRRRIFERSNTLPTFPSLGSRYLRLLRHQAISCTRTNRTNGLAHVVNLNFELAYKLYIQLQHIKAVFWGERAYQLIAKTLGLSLNRRLQQRQPRRKQPV